MPDYTITNHYNPRTGADGWRITLKDQPRLSFHLRKIVTGFCADHFAMWAYLDTAQAPIHYWPMLEAQTITGAAKYALEWAWRAWQDNQLPTIELGGFWPGDICRQVGTLDAVYVVRLDKSKGEGGQDHIAIFNAENGQLASVQPANLILFERQTLELEITTLPANLRLKPDQLGVRFPQIAGRYYVIDFPARPFEEAITMLCNASTDHKPLRTWRQLGNTAEAIRTAQIDALTSAIRLTADENDADQLHRRGHEGDQFTHTTKYGESPYERGFYCTMYSVHFTLTDWTGKGDTGCWATDCWTSARSGTAREIIKRGNRWADWLPLKE